MNFNENKNDEDTTNEERFIQFKLGNEHFAIPLLSIKEVATIPDTTPVPNTPKFHKGIMNLRGQIISVIDLREKLGITPLENNKEAAVIIVEIESVSIGLVVDSILKVFKATEQDLEIVPEVSNQVNSKYMKSVFKSEGNLIIILDLSVAFDIEKLKESA